MIAKIKLLWKYFEEHAVAFGVVCTIVGILIGGGSTYYIGFYTNSQALLKSDYDNAKTAEQSIDNALQPYSDKATLGKVPAKDSFDDLQSGIKALYSSGEQIVLRYPAAKPEFDALFDAMKNLQDSAPTFQGPLDAKQFVAATAAFYAAEDAFNAKVTRKQGKWIAWD